MEHSRDSVNTERPEWQPNEQVRRLLKRVSYYTHFVTMSKLLLIGFSVLLLGAIVLIPILSEEQGQHLIFTAPTEENTVQNKPVMQNPRFQGVDNKNQPYLVTADSATQQDADTIMLEKVSADMTFEDATWMLVTSERGRLKLNEQDLILAGDVKLFHDEGYELETERVRVDMKKGEAYGDKPLEGKGVMGFLQSEQFAIYNRGERMHFFGPVKLTIYPE